MTEIRVLRWPETRWMVGSLESAQLRKTYTRALSHRSGFCGRPRARTRDGRSRYLVKPFAFSELLACVHTIIRRVHTDTSWPPATALRQRRFLAACTTSTAWKRRPHSAELNFCGPQPHSQLPNMLPSPMPPACATSPPLTFLPSSSLALSTSISPPWAVTLKP